MEQSRDAAENMVPDAVCDGGDLDCGSGLLLIIRKAIQPLLEGQVLEIRSTEISVREDLPAWCRMTQNPYLGWKPGKDHNKYLVRKGSTVTPDESFDAARQYQWQARVSWIEGLQARVFVRNHSFDVGQPASFDVKDRVPSAVEYLLGALGACLVNGFRLHASRRGITVDNIEIALSGTIDNIMVFLGLEQTGHPGFQHITGTLYVQTDADEEVINALWHDTLSKSPVAASLGRPVQLDIQCRMI